MTMDRFVSPYPLPTAYEREVLTILCEECAEVIQRATKILRFGVTETQLGQIFTNADRLSHELGDLECLIALACDTGLAYRSVIAVARQAKAEKLHVYMQTKPGDA